MAPAHILAAAKLGAGGAIVATVGAGAHIIAAATTAGGGIDLNALVSGGGTITAGGVLGLVAYKMMRGELVARDTAQANAALTRLIEDGRKREDAGERREQQARDDRQRMFRNEERMLDALTDRKG